MLTKRADRLHLLLGGVLASFAKMPNIWWGVSVENRKHGVPRIALLQDALAAVRFLSIEPLLEDLGRSGGHRRVRFSDLQKYRELRDRKRRQILNDMTREVHEQGLNWD